MTTVHGVNVTPPRRTMAASTESEGRERVSFTAETDLRRAQLHLAEPHPGGWGKPAGHLVPPGRCLAVRRPEIS